MSARQLKKDNEAPRMCAATKAFALANDTGRVGDMYRELQRKKSEAERQLREEIERYKREHGYTD